MIAVKRIYEAATEQDGFRVLVDRIWPKGLTKARTKLHAWTKEVAPGTPLRKWFNHDPQKWEEFKTQYKAELKEQPEALKHLKALEKEHKKITLLYAAKSTSYNQAVVLKEVLDAME